MNFVDLARKYNWAINNANQDTAKELDELILKNIGNVLAKLN